MADEEKKLDDDDATAKADAAKPEASSTVSHSEPAVVHSGLDVPPLADDQDHAPGHATDSHGHDAHGHDDHAHSASGAEFGEVIPEKNWQDSLLAGIAALVLCGFLFLGYTWSQVTPPPEHEEVATPPTHSSVETPALPAPSVNPKFKQIPANEYENPIQPSDSAHPAPRHLGK
jgi:hypothetical protein